MKLSFKKIYFICPILSILYILNMKGMLNNGQIMLINTGFFALYCIRGILKKRTIDTLFECMIISMPLSFLSFTGSDYGKLPLSWFNIFYILIISYAILYEKLSYLPWLGLVIIVGIIELLLSSDLRNALNQYINIVLFSFSFVIGKGFFYKKINHFHIYIRYIKIIVLSYAFAVIAQDFLMKRGFNIGTFDYLGSSRLSLGATFTDYSFASLFLFVGISIYFMHMGKSNSKKALNSCCILIVFFASFIVNARTGIVGFFIAFFMYLLIAIAKKKVKFLTIIAACCIIPVILSSALYISNSREQALFNGSGRMITYEAGLKAFFSHPFTGVGFGVQSYKNIINEAIPHNFIIQYLAQTGLIYTSILLTPLFFCIYFSYRKNMSMFLSLLTTFIGGMFIPDILNSRFIILLIIIFYSEKGVCERRVLYEGKNCNILHVE